MAFMTPHSAFLTGREAKEYGAGTRKGWYARLSASGYMDCTDWMGPYSSEDEAIVELCEFWEVDTEGESEGSEDYDDTELSELRAKVCSGKRK